jgi:DNA recombination protein RmuC
MAILQSKIAQLEHSIKTDFSLNRTETNNTIKSGLDGLIQKTDANHKLNRDDLRTGLIDLTQELKNKFTDLTEGQSKLVQQTEKKLEQMRETVDEKLQKTLNERLGQSFEAVGKQLEAVQLGLGEMKTLAGDVGGLKKVLSNVKMRGGIGEVQLAMLLEQILAPEQYAANVKTKQNSADIVEFAIKLPGRDDNNKQVWLPIDAKFPKDVYEQLQTAYDASDLPEIEAAQKNLEQTIKKMAKDISDKYLDPPNTTDFAILFLPFEGIYAEVVRKASLLEDLQRNYKIIVTGPSTLAAILNSLQMGFKTLAIQKRSGEVWKVLGNVKTEFEKFGGLIEKAQGNIQNGLKQLDEVVGVRTRAIQRQLRDVEVLNDAPNVLNALENPELPLD